MINRLEAIDEVTKIVIGLSSVCRHAFTPGMAKIQATTEAGVRLNVYGGNGITSVFVVVAPENREAVLEKVSEFIVIPKEKEEDAKGKDTASVVRSKRKGKLVASDKRKQRKRGG